VHVREELAVTQYPALLLTPGLFEAAAVNDAADRAGAASGSVTSVSLG
jgi:hypothetical protein